MPIATATPGLKPANPGPKAAPFGPRPEKSKSFGAGRPPKPCAGTSIRGWDVLRKNLSAAKAILRLVNARIGAKRALHCGVFASKEVSSVRKIATVTKVGLVLVRRSGVGASARDAAWRKTASATGARGATITQRRRALLLAARPRNTRANLAPARPFLGGKTRQRTARELSTNAKKVTVSVLYWYTYFPGSLI